LQIGIVDNYATHKHPKVREWLARHPRWTFHFFVWTAKPRKILAAVKRGREALDSIH
jgi:hypothetical protein